VNEFGITQKRRLLRDYRDHRIVVHRSSVGKLPRLFVLTRPDGLYLDSTKMGSTVITTMISYYDLYD